MNKKVKIGIIITAAAIAAVSILVIAAHVYYGSRWYANTWIGEHELSGMRYEESEQLLQKVYDNYQLQIRGRNDGKLVIAKNDISYEVDLKEALQKVINECGLKNVFLLPYKPHAETLRYFSAADAFLFPSKEDIYGHVINEALSQGIPVISSPKVNATTHLIQEGKNGHIISFQNEEELNRALSSIPSKDMESNALAVGKENTLEKSAGFFLNYFSGERL